MSLARWLESLGRKLHRSLETLLRHSQLAHNRSVLKLFANSRDGSRTHTGGILSPLPLPLGYPAAKAYSIIISAALRNEIVARGISELQLTIGALGGVFSLSGRV